MLSVTVVNTPPEVDPSVSGEALDLFRRSIGNEEAFPFAHQARAFQLIQEGKECVLVAGTAAGKTFALLLPLLLRIRNETTRKILFLYPALALLEDQLETIRKVAGLLGLDDHVGYVYGGMSRQELMVQLNKRILVATPDAVYWFLEKNVKYSSILFYSLCHVDDVVIDEAHLLSGLMGYNLKKFLDRISTIRQQFLLKESFRVHVLTATPTDVVSLLSQGEKVQGRSKVGEVVFECETRALSNRDVSNWRELLYEEIDRGFGRMLLVMNSAAAAHRLFHQNTVEDLDLSRNSNFLPFGQVKFVDLFTAIHPLVKDFGRMENWVLTRTQGHLIPFGKLNRDDRVTLSIEALLEVGQNLVQSIVNELFGQAEEYFQNDYGPTFQPTGNLRNHVFMLQQAGSLLQESYQQTVRCYGEQTQHLWEEAVANLFSYKEEMTASIAEWEYRLDGLFKPEWLSPFNERFVQALKRLPVSLEKVTMSAHAKAQVANGWVYVSTVREECAALQISFDQVMERLLSQRSVSTRYIRTVKDTKIPVILYTGSMTKRARMGLVQAFQSPELEKAIMISTSAVEAGVDFDVDVLITEECTGSSFLQRFGRVGRRGGRQQRVKLVTHNADLVGQLNEIFHAQKECKRDEFSSHVQAVFKKREYFSSSLYLELLQDHVTRRIGETGRMIVPKPTDTDSLILAHGGYRYGLRSTLPQVALLDEGVSRDLFQTLAVVPSNKLHAQRNSFTIAKADVYFDEMIYYPWEQEIIIDQDKTLCHTELLFYVHEGQLCAIRPGALFRYPQKRNRRGFVYREVIHNHLNRETHVRQLLKSEHAEAVAMRPYLQAVYRNPLLNRYILGFGTVYLLADRREPTLRSVVDADGDAILLKNQFFLIQPHQHDTQFEHASDRWTAYEQELYVKSYKDYPAGTATGHIALDRVAGACVELYRKLVTNE